jgi:hypothetical protein
VLRGSSVNNAGGKSRYLMLKYYTTIQHLTGLSISNVGE